jgi:hypothetical protein
MKDGMITTMCHLFFYLTTTQIWSMLTFVLAINLRRLKMTTITILSNKRQVISRLEYSNISYEKAVAVRELELVKLFLEGTKAYAVLIHG